MSVFEVAIGRDAKPGRFRVDVLSSPDGGLACAVTDIDVDSLLARRRDLELAVLLSGVSARKVFPEEQQVRDVGQVLFRALLGTGEVAGRYRAAAAVAAERGERLRVVLRMADPALAALPWEAMFDEAAGGYVCRRDQLVRHVGVLGAKAPLPVDPPLRILGVISSPRGLPPLNVTAEKELLTRTLAKAADGLAEVTWAPSATWADLQDVLLSQRWHVVHFIGHGDFDRELDEGVLALTGEDGGVDLVAASRLVSLLSEADPSPRLVVLNSCSGAASGVTDLFSGTATALVRSGIRAVAAMQYKISDPAATAFTRGFYRTLVTPDKGVDQAVSSGRVAIIGLPGGRTLEWVTPVLYQSSPDSRLFTIRPVASGGAPAASPATPRARARRAPSHLARTIRAHRDGVFSVAFSPDGTLLASAGADRAVRLWRAATGAESAAFTSPDCLVRSVAFRPDGETIASAWSNGTVRLLPATDWSAWVPVRRTPARQSERDLALTPPDVDLLLDELSRVFSTEPRATSFLLAVRFPARLIPAWYSDAFEFWARIFEDIDRGAMEAPYRRLIAGAVRVYGANRVLEDLERRYQEPGEPAATEAPDQLRELTGHTGWVLDVAFSPDGSMLASVGSDTRVLLRRLPGASVSHFGMVQRANGLAFSPDSAMLAIADENQTVGLWSTASRRQVRTLLGHRGKVLGVAFSPDGRLIASAASDSSVRLWDAATGSDVRVLTGAFRGASAVAFSPDGQVLAAATDDHVTLWNLAGDELDTLGGHDGTVHDVAFSPDGALLASAGGDGEIRLWE